MINIYRFVIRTKRKPENDATEDTLQTMAKDNKILEDCFSVSEITTDSDLENVEMFL